MFTTARDRPPITVINQVWQNLPCLSNALNVGSRRQARDRHVILHWRRKIGDGPDRHDASWIYRWMALIVVPFDMGEVDRLAHPFNLIESARVGP